MKLRHLGPAGFLLAILLAAAPASAEQTYDIGVLLPTTGTGAFLGNAETDALVLAEKLINRDGGVGGKNIHFIVQDDQSSPQLAVQTATQMKGSRPAILMGPTLTSTCNAVSPLMRNGPFLYCFSPSIHPDAGSYVFTAGVSTYDLQRALLAYLRTSGLKKIALIASTDASGQDAARGIEAALALPTNSDMKLIAQSRYNPNDVSVAAQIELIKQAGPDVVIAWSTGTAVATVFKGLSQAGLDIPVATSNGNMTYAQMKEYADFLPKTLYIASSVWLAHNTKGAEIDPAIEKAQVAFFTAFSEAGLRPDVGATNVWDAAFIVADALRHLGTTATSTQIRDYIAELTNFTGINGHYDFKKIPQRGLDESAAVVTRWDAVKGDWQVISRPGGALLKP